MADDLPALLIWPKGIGIFLELDLWVAVAAFWYVAV